ncbi:MAG: hypothetical protein M1840_000462 [Geoglossum simile]|nr:MAG: hypothetical protein M1840_000462 [Geoglossum simile]
MPRKRSARMAEMNSRMEEAIVTVRNNQFKHITDAATHFEVNYETLLRRLKGRQTYAQSHESQQLLSKAEEDTLYFSPPNPTLLKEANAAFNTQVLGGKPLDSPALRHTKNLAHISERLAAQVAILQKENKEQELILKKRKKRPSGKRAAMQGHFILSTAEIRNKVLAAELETARKKSKKTTTRKRKRQETPLEDEEEVWISPVTAKVVAPATVLWSGSANGVGG